MANIIPFNGYRYNENKIEDLGKVMAPPYDSISDEERNSLYELDPYNSVRLVLGMPYLNDSDTNNCYTRAADTLNQWINDEIIIRDSDDVIYMYEQEIKVNDTHFTNRSFISLLELEQFSKGGIMPCEETITSSKKDRYQLLSHTNANISMINCMYIETEKHLANIINDISETTPTMDFQTPEGIRQRVWKISDPEIINEFQASMKNKPLYITDGQNRYETCLDYKEHMQKNNPNHTGDEKYNYIMTLFTDAHEDGLVQVPVHRLITCPKGFNEEYFVAGAQDHFKVEKIIVDTSIQELVDTMKKQIATPRKQNRIALYCGGNYFYRLTILEDGYLNELMPDNSEAYRSLDVTVLNNLLLSELLNINSDNYHERVTFIKRSDTGLEKVRNKEYDCIFLINAAKPSQISGVATAGEKMPERSICIFPKPVTGIVFNKLD